jgi:hypothetical protein
LRLKIPLGLGLDLFHVNAWIKNRKGVEVMI